LKNGNKYWFTPTPLEFYHRTFTGKKLIFGKVTYEK